MRTLYKMFGKSMLASICIIGALIMALLPPAAVGAGSFESGFHISQWTGETWEEIYQHQFQVQYSTEAFTVGVVDGRVPLRIVQIGTPFADIDQISLMVDGEELTPEYARYTGSGESILEDILELDHNVVIAHEQEIEVSWDVPAGNDRVTVYLTANEYGHGVPLHFPKTGYATYDMGSNIGTITVDGLIDETDGTVPLYSPYWQSSSGHPDGYTYIYVCDDEEYVYFSLDVTGDNTNEYGEDWAEISILQPDGSEKAFRIDDYDNTWGASGFGLTSKASYKHQTCEFAIPKSIIGNENIEFRLAYYGTFSGDYTINAARYLEIQIDGDSSEGQVFNVSDTLNITGLVWSEAAIKLYGGNGTADVYVELSVTGPSGTDSDSYTDNDTASAPDWVYAGIHHASNWTSVLYPLTHVGLHTITLYSEAHCEGPTEHEGYVDESDTAEISLDFWVGLALAIDDVTVNEDAGYATFNVSLSSDPDSPVTVDYSTSDGLATEGSDYTAVASTTLTFNPSAPLSQTIDVVIIDDALHEVNETFHVNLTNATGEAGISDDTGVGIIIDNDDGPTIGRLFMVNGAYGLWNELIYDDGAAESNLNHGSDLGVSLVKFAPPGEPIRLTTLYFWMAGGNVSAELKVIIFDKDGNQVYLSEIYDSWDDGTWNSIDLDSESTPVMSDDFYAGIQHQTADSMLVGMDTSSAAANRSYWGYPPYTSLYQGHDNLMIRVGGYTVAGNEIVELDPDTGAVTNTIPSPSDTDGGGDGLAYGDGRMFFTTIDTSDIYEIDPSDGSVDNSFPGPETYGGIDALGFSCDKLYALEYGPEPTIHILNPDTGATSGNLSPSVYLVGGGTFAGTRGSLFFSGYDDTDTLIYEINTTTGAVINSFSPPVEGEEDGLYGLGFSSSRNTLFVGYFDSNMVYEVDPDDGTVINSFLGPEGAEISALAADEYECEEESCLPVVGSVTETAFDTDTTAHNVSMPTTVDAGDLLIVLFANDGYGVNATTPIGWNLLDSRPANGCTLSAYYRVATGTEGGTGVDITTSNSEEAVAQVYRITNWHGTTPPEISTDAVGLTAAPDPYGLNPSGWDLEDTLWIAVAGQEFGGGSPTYPTDYIDGISTISSNHTTRCGMHSAIRINTATSENPGPFGIGGSAQWVAYTIAVRPPVCGGGTTCETFYSSGDDFIEKQGTVYATAHDAASGDFIGGAYDLWIGQESSGSGWYYIDRAFLYFDTSSIPDGATINSASIHLRGWTDDSDTDFDLTVVNGQPTYPHDPLVVGDYDITQYSGNGGVLNTVSFNDSGYNTIPLNATGMGWISKTGTTKLGIFSSADISGTTPSGPEYVVVYSSFQPGSDHDPYLEVCYTTGGGDTPPVANDNSVGTAEDTPLPFAACNFPYSDVDGDSRTAVKIVSLPSHGTLNYSGSTLNATPYIIDEADISNLSFEPAANENGSPYTTFGFQVQAGGAWSANTANMTIAVTPVNDAPIAVADCSYTTNEDTTLIVGFGGGLLGNDLDIDGPSLTVHGFTLPSHGTLSMDPSADGSFNYTPHSGYNGTDGFTYRATDGSAESNWADVCILIYGANEAPVITEGDAANVTMSEDGWPTDFSLTLHATDANGDTLTWSISSPASHGSAVASGTGPAKDINYGPTPDYNGSDSFEVQVDDGNSGIDTIIVNVTIEPVNDAPLITEGASIGVTMSEDGVPTAFNLTLHATDIEGDTLTWSISSPASHGLAVASGTGPSKVINYAPNPNYNGSDSFEVQVDDGNSGIDTIIVNVTIESENDCPIIVSVSPASQTVQFSDRIDPITIVASDADGDPLTLVDVPYDLNAVEGPTNTWVISGQFMEDHDGTYIIKVDDGECRIPAANITRVKECVIVRFDNHNPMSVESDDAPTVLDTDAEFTVHIKQDPDGYLGWPDLPTTDPDAWVEMQIVPVDGGPPINMHFEYSSNPDVFSDGAPVSFTFTPPANGLFDIGTYIIEVTVLSDYYKVCGGAESLLMVYDPDVGASGSGTFEDDGDTYSFAFLVNYNKKGTNLRGSLVIIRELSGGGIYRIQSNALYELAVDSDSDAKGDFDRATFGGKCTYIGPDVLDDYGDPQNVGGQEFIVYLEDYDLNGGASSEADEFWFTVLGRDFTLDFNSNNRADSGEVMEIDGDIIIPDRPTNVGRGRGRH